MHPEYLNGMKKMCACDSSKFSQTHKYKQDIEQTEWRVTADE